MVPVYACIAVTVYQISRQDQFSTKKTRRRSKNVNL